MVLSFENSGTKSPRQDLDSYIYIDPKSNDMESTYSVNTECLLIPIGTNVPQAKWLWQSATGEVPQAKAGHTHQNL